MNTANTVTAKTNNTKTAAATTTIGWEDVNNRVKSTNDYITINSNVVCFNSLCVQKYKLGRFSRVSILVHQGKELVGFRFHNNKAKGLSFYNSRGQKCFSARKLNSYPWVKKVSAKTANLRHFTPFLDKENKLLVISLKKGR